jgi:hypothetical protein
MNEIVKFEFHGDALDVVDPKDHPSVVIRSITDALGLNHAGVLQRLQRKAWGKTAVCMMHTTGSDGKTYEMATLDIRRLPMLLATVDASRCKPAIRAKVELYQEEAAEALADRFLGRRGESNERIRMLETNVIELMRRICDRPNGLLGPGAKDLRARIAMVAEQRQSLGDPYSTRNHVENEVRMIVGYPKVRGAKWEHCPAEVATRAHSYVAGLIETLGKRIAKLARAPKTPTLFDRPS